MWLTNCARSIEAVRPNLPDVRTEQPDLVTCKDRALAELPPGDWTRAQVTQIIGDVRKSEVYKDRCAKAWGSFYEDLRTNLRVFGQ